MERCRTHQTHPACSAKKNAPIMSTMKNQHNVSDATLSLPSSTISPLQSPFVRSALPKDQWPGQQRVGAYDPPLPSLEAGNTTPKQTLPNHALSRTPEPGAGLPRRGIRRE